MIKKKRKKNLRKILGFRPIPVKEILTDNGGEFNNEMVEHLIIKTKPPVRINQEPMGLWSHVLSQIIGLNTYLLYYWHTERRLIHLRVLHRID